MSSKNSFGCLFDKLYVKQKVIRKVDSILLTMAILKKKLSWLGHILWTKDDKLLKIAGFGHPYGDKRKAVRHQIGWEEVVRKD